MDQMTQQNAVMMEQSTTASRTLAGEIKTLQSLVAFFEVGGVKRSTPKAAARPTPKPAAPKSAPAASSEEWSEF